LSAFNKKIIDPTTGLQFAGSLIPTSKISPISAALAKFYPDPNAPNPTQNYSNNLAAVNDSNNYLIKVDHNITAAKI